MSIVSGKPYWLLERGKEEGSFNQPVWWLGDSYHDGDPAGWTTDARYAIKFQTKAEAEKYLREFQIPVKVTEHLFA